MECLDIYDKNKIFTGKKIIRGTKISDDEYIRLVVVFIKNNKNEFLIQKTAENRNSLYSTTGGHVQSGDELMLSMIREIKEEIGLSIAEKDLKLIKEITLPKRHFYVYYLENNNYIEDFIIQQEEVAELFWMPKEQIEELINQDKFIPSHAHLLKKCF